MNQATALKILEDLNVLYETTMKMYQDFFYMLDKIIELAPENDTARLEDLNALAQEAKEALESDLGMFDKALNEDTETLQKIEEQLKINELYRKLGQ